MLDTTPTVRLIGLKNPATLEQYVSSSLVDVAYVFSIGDSTAELVLEGVDSRLKEDRDWVADIIKAALADCGETQARIEFL